MFASDAILYQFKKMQSWQEMLCTQLNHAVVDQFDSFLSNDLTKLESLKLAYDQSRSGNGSVITT